MAVYRSFRGDSEAPSWYRAAHRRLRRLRWHDGWTRERWWLLVALLVVGALIGTGVIRHPVHHGVSDQRRER